MKKETLLQIILGTVGGLIFPIGMCMCLLPEWNMFVPGVVTTIVGIIILLSIIVIYRKNHPKTIHKEIDWGVLCPWIIGTVGALIMGFGMSKILVENTSTSDMVVGLITGIVGLIICVLVYPIYAYIKNPKE